MPSIESTASLSDIASKLDYMYTAQLFIIGSVAAIIVIFVLYKAIIAFVEY
jgi:hypothetical protein